MCSNKTMFLFRNISQKKFFQASDGFCYFDVASDDVDRFLSPVIFGCISVRIKNYVSHGVINQKKVIALIGGEKEDMRISNFFSQKLTAL